MSNKIVKNVPIGEMIKKVFEQKDMSLAEFAKRVGCKPQNMYSIFRRKKMDVDQLCIISKTLNYNFIGKIAEKHEYPLEIPLHKTTIVLDVQDLDSKKLRSLLNFIKQLNIRMIDIKED
ncbi:MAG: helix-turn-helix domain-containing protein [Lentimicrobiaceae bacterium]|nr:helix-turn-helix domain-containing protein [Lentimicrobiaceae bacterium]